MKYFIFMIALLAIACQSPPDPGHSHEEEGAHTHEAGDIPSVEYTVWTGQTELFVEFPALTVGEISRFAAHFTILDGHRPVETGSVTASLILGNKGIRHTVDAPSSPGIFAPALQPKEAGLYRLVFELSTPAYTDRIELDSIRVHASAEEAQAALGGEDGGGGDITFLKEQAWKMEFQTAMVGKKEIYQVIPTSGIWKVAPSDYQTLVAPTGGKVTFEMKHLAVGSPVRKGQVVMTVSSRGLTEGNLEAEIRKARAELDQASSAFERKKTLHESDIVPTSELEEAEQAYLVAKANYETLNSGYTDGGKQVIAPIGGYITSLEAANGGFAEQGTALATISSQRSSILEVRVSPSYASELQHIRNLWYQTATDVWSNMNDRGGRILSVGKEVNPDQPLLAVIAEVNEAVKMPAGSYTEVRIATGSPGEGVVVPASALMEDYGYHSVIVQRSGESFEKRNVVTGRRNGPEVEVVKGLAAGEVIVTKGAYQVKMASMSGQVPAHGHVH